MICRKCGHQNEDGVLFCEQCKEDLDAPVTSSSIASAFTAGDPLPLEPLPVAPFDDIPVLEPVVPEPPAVLPPMLTPATPPDFSAPVVSHYSDTVPLAAVEASSAPETIAPPIITSSPIVTATPPQDATATFTPAATRKPKLIVIRGLRIDAVYPLWEGPNYIGRTDDQPVDIDLDDQESPDRIWCSRQHAIIHVANDKVTIEDLKSMNGTFVNRTRVHPGEQRELVENDVVQIGTVHMKVVYS